MHNEYSTEYFHFVIKSIKIHCYEGVTVSEHSSWSSISTEQLKIKTKLHSNRTKYFQLDLVKKKISVPYYKINTNWNKLTCSVKNVTW